MCAAGGVAWREVRRSSVLPVRPLRRWFDQVGPGTELVLDLTCPFEVLPSGTPGHAHLFLDVVLTWRQYEDLLRRMDAAGIIESGFLRTTLRRGAAHVRLPWVTRQTHAQSPAQRASAEVEMPGTMARELLMWNERERPVEPYDDGETLVNRATVGCHSIRFADLISSRLCDRRGKHAPILSLDGGARVDPLSGRLMLVVDGSAGSKARVLQALDALGVLATIEDPPVEGPPALPVPR